MGIVFTGRNRLHRTQGGGVSARARVAAGSGILVVARGEERRGAQGDEHIDDKSEDDEIEIVGRNDAAQHANPVGEHHGEEHPEVALGAAAHAFRPRQHVWMSGAALPLGDDETGRRQEEQGNGQDDHVSPYANVALRAAVWRRFFAAWARVVAKRLQGSSSSRTANSEHSISIPAPVTNSNS